MSKSRRRRFWRCSAGNNFMEESKHRSRHFDTQAFLYRSITQILIIIGIGLLTKVAFVDAVRMSGGQMNPTILPGDMLLVFRTPYLKLFSKAIKPGLKKPVLFKMPSDENNIGCLRIAAFSSDTILIDNGRCINSRNPSMTFPLRAKKESVLPEDYSPRDYLKPYRIPAAGDTLLMENIPIRDFFFAVSIMRQEQAGKITTVKPLLYINDTLTSTYTIEGFALYNGFIDSVPDQTKNDWFFWNRMEQYLKQTNPDKNMSLSFAVFVDGSRIHRYTVRKDYVFLLADNWNGGLDSRYYGPVQSSNIIGRVFTVLWSYKSEPGKKGQIRLNRFGRIIT